MLSDALSDAVGEIESYQTDFADVYEANRPLIDKVKTVMRGLQLFYDTPPADGSDVPPHLKQWSAAKMGKIFKALEALDVSGIREAIDFNPTNDN